MWIRSELKDHAKNILKLTYWKAVLMSLILMAITGGCAGSSSSSIRKNYNSYSPSSGRTGNFSPDHAGYIVTFLVIFLIVFLVIFAISYAFSAFLMNPLVVGCQRFFVLCLQKPTSINEVGFGFSRSYLSIVKTMFLKSLYTFLWSLLFIIPGIIKSYEYRMIPFILAENPGLSTKEVFERSRIMMDGEKWKTFVLDLSFWGWYFLSIFTCAILAIFYVNPYYYLTCAELYAVLKQKLGSSHSQNGSTASTQDASYSQNQFTGNPYQ